MSGSVSKSLKFCLWAAASAAFAMPVLAQTDARDNPPVERLDRGDRNKRGPAQSGTFIKPIGLLFSGMDSNSDAVITSAELTAGIQSEWTAFGGRPSGAVFSQWSIKHLGSIDAMPTFLSFDRDFNGVVSKTEFEQRLRSEFETLDKNEDEHVTRSEMIVVIHERGGRGRSEGQDIERRQRVQDRRGGGRSRR